MKQMKKLIVTFLVAAMVLAPCATVVQAAIKVPKSQTLYMQPDVNNEKGIVYGSIPVSGLSESQKITKSSVKSSKKSVVEVSYIGSGSIGYTLKKPGTATISFKIGNKKYQTKINGKKYTNPVKSVSITGIKNGSKTNLASLTNKSLSTKMLKLSKAVKNPKVQVAAKSGWKIQSVYYTDGNVVSSGFESGSKTFKKPVSKATVRIFTKSKKLKTDVGGNRISISFINTKNKNVVTLIYNINMLPGTVIIG